MANALYDHGRDAFLNGDLDWDADDFRLILIDEDEDTPDLANDEFLDDRLADARVAISGAMTTSVPGAGVADADDVVFSAVTGAESESLDCYQHTGTEGDSALVFNIDTATGLPITPNGADITVVWDSGSNRIFRL